MEEYISTAVDEYFKISEKQDGRSLLCLFAKNEPVDMFNSLITKKMHIVTETLFAIDSNKHEKLKFK